MHNTVVIREQFNKVHFSSMYKLQQAHSNHIIKSRQNNPKHYD